MVVTDGRNMIGTITIKEWVLSESHLMGFGGRNGPGNVEWRISSGELLRDDIAIHEAHNQTGTVRSRISRPMRLRYPGAVYRRLVYAVCDGPFSYRIEEGSRQIQMHGA